VTEPVLQSAHPLRPRVLFVDDEQRVLNSMRVMFRRQYDLYLASDGAEALGVIKNNDIDVIVADHRMPRMTGVEVLSAVRKNSPRTVRILLTGYADLDAVEGSINDGEVFRFLTKPCAPQQLRETIEQAARIARATSAADAGQLAAPQDAAAESEDMVEIILEADTVREVISESGLYRAPPAARVEPRRDFDTTDVIERPSLDPTPVTAPTRAPHMPRPTLASETRAPSEPPLASAPTPKPKRRLAAGLAVIVFTNDGEIVDTVQKAVRGRLPVYTATNIVQVVRILNERRPGVLVTDISEDKTAIQAMTARLKEHVPELVTIAVSQHRDVLDMVWLINHGQIFRFLRKPVSPGRCAVSLQAALQHHRMLLKNPDLVKRYEIDSPSELGLVEGVLEKIKSVKRLWASV
jgi:DNA-binding NtrC family response regulator